MQLCSEKNSIHSVHCCLHERLEYAYMLLLPVRLILFHHAGCQLQHQCRHRVWSVMIDITELLVYLIWLWICNCIVMFKQHLETYWTYIYQWWSDSDLACQVQISKNWTTGEHNACEPPYAIVSVNSARSNNSMLVWFCMHITEAWCAGTYYTANKNPS
jgi:hypothetical protein